MIFVETKYEVETFLVNLRRSLHNDLALNSIIN